MEQTTRSKTGFFDPAACDISEFLTLVTKQLGSHDVPHAAEVAHNIPVYDMAELAPVLNDTKGRCALLTEWGWVLGQSAGVVALRGAYPETAPIDAATRIYEEVILEEREAGSGHDHFAAAGANDRVWNTLQKLCERDPAIFAAYFGNPAIAAVCEAWLGPNYQMTAQLNVVRPGGAAQEAHRDYHLGFMTAEQAASYPAHVHDLSAALTLQGAIAHTDMPVESGPTKLLPFSQLYRPGYLAFRLDAFRQAFEEHYVQLPLRKGDALFFNPALFHAAGANTSTDIQRAANLLQISSALGIPLEKIDRMAMCKRLYPVLLDGQLALSPDQVDAAIAACADGYSFSTNLDRDPPVGGLAPQTQAALMRQALDEKWGPEKFGAALDAQAERRSASLL
ncbi:phytanoyl-CoA dioxygenase family protein [Ruegeria jejuensis]|uniref:phytanoyl-CoA dioxygenase family protein n=1 Tax=Ruegeria jejuensis TaxID=3233338 RepID=UPI00355B6C11